MKLHRVTDEEMIEAAKVADSTTDLLGMLGYAQSGPNQQSARERLSDLGITDRKFFTSFKRVEKPNRSYSDEDIFVENSTYKNNNRLKDRLINRGLLEYRCYGEGCSVTDEWLGKKIVLQLDHVNGVRNDNRVENLTLLCPNCHTQTETHCRGTRPRSKRRCDCGNPKSYGAKMCRACKDKGQAAIDYPPVAEVVAMVEELGTYAAAGRELGVSSTQISQYIKSRSKQ